MKMTIFRCILDEKITFFLSTRSFLWTKYAKSVCVCGRSCARTLLGSLRRFPRPPCRLGRGRPSPDPRLLGAFGAPTTRFQHDTEPYHFLKRSGAFIVCNGLVLMKVESSDMRNRMYLAVGASIQPEGRSSDSTLLLCRWYAVRWDNQGWDAQSTRCRSHAIIIIITVVIAIIIGGPDHGPNFRCLNCQKSAGVTDIFFCF